MPGKVFCQDKGKELVGAAVLVGREAAPLMLGAMTPSALGTEVTAKGVNVQHLPGPQALLPLLHKLGMRLGQLNSRQWEKGLTLPGDLLLQVPSHLGTRHEPASPAAGAPGRLGPWGQHVPEGCVLSSGGRASRS